MGLSSCTCHDPAPHPADYLKKILTARVYDVAVESALEPAKNLQPPPAQQGAPEARGPATRVQLQAAGAYNKMAHLTPEQLQRGVICASAGNHAQGVAMSAHRLGTRAVIVMPTTTPQLKIDAVKTLGGDQVVLFGENYSDAYGHSVQLEKRTEALTFVHPFDDPDVRKPGHHRHGDPAPAAKPGQQPARRRVRGHWRRRASSRAWPTTSRPCGPEIKVIGVQMNDSGRHDPVGAGHERVTLADVGLFSDGTAVKLVGEETFRVAQAWWMTTWWSTPTPSAPPSRTSLWTRAASWSPRRHGRGRHQTVRGPEQDQGRDLRRHHPCGANMNFDRLRFVAERAGGGREREALLAVTIPEEARQLPPVLRGGGRPGARAT